MGKFDVLVGINLLREGLDLPEVSLIAILDADKEGFLRTETSLIQTVGRAARNEHGRVIMYADYISKAMRVCIDETARRRKAQDEYNKAHGIVPKTIVKPVREIARATGEYRGERDLKDSKSMTAAELRDTIRDIEKSMKAELRDVLFELRTDSRWKRI